MDKVTLNSSRGADLEEVCSSQEHVVSIIMKGSNKTREYQLGISESVENLDFVNSVKRPHIFSQKGYYLVKPIGTLHFGINPGVLSPSIMYDRAVVEVIQASEKLNKLLKEYFSDSIFHYDPSVSTLTGGAFATAAIDSKDGQKLKTLEFKIAVLKSFAKSLGMETESIIYETVSQGKYAT